MRASIGLLAPLFLLAGCSAKLVRPESIAVCRQGRCETVADAAGRDRLLTAVHEVFRAAKGREFTLHEAKPGKPPHKDGISFFVQGGPIPGRSTIGSISVADIRFIDRDRSEIKFALKNHATYVGIPTLCAESQAVVALLDDEAKMTYAPFCTWLGIGYGVFRLEWSIDRVDVDAREISGYWSMRGKGVPIVGWGSGYMVGRFGRKPPPVVEAPAPAPVVETPKPVPVAAKAEPVVETVETVSEAARLTLATKVGDANGDLVLEGGENITFEASVANAGPGPASQVRVVLSGEPALVSCLGDGKSLGALAAGAKATASFSCVLPPGVPDDTVSLRVEVLSGEKAARAAAKVLKVGMRPALAEAAEEVVSEIGVDDIPPRSRSAGRGNSALVIGLSRYREKAIPAVKYASRDAEVMARYLQNLGGVAEENLKILMDDSATKSDLEAYLEDWLPRHSSPDGTVFVYYAGHGAPSPDGKESYLVPYEGHPDFPSKLYPLSRMYAALAKLPAKNVVVMLDSCFSGAGGRGVSQAGARPLVSVAPAVLDPKLAVFAGATGGQISSDHDKSEHGLFTYYLLKGMRGDADADKDLVVTLGELAPFVREQVRARASRELNRDQTPTLLGAPRPALPVARR